MNRGTLKALLAARAAIRPVLLVTPLDGSAQRLLDAAGLELLGLTDPELAAAAQNALDRDRAWLFERDGSGILLTPHNPPLRLIVVGAVHIAEALCAMARIAGYAVTLVDPRAAFLRQDRFPGVTLLGEWPQQAFLQLKPDTRTAVVLLTHDPKIDDPALLATLPGESFYIGALGSKRTHARRLERLAAQGVAPELLARVYGPAGLNIGSRSPAEIAVSVLAQMTQVLRGAGEQN